MYSISFLLIVVSVYGLLLFGTGLWVENRPDRGHKFINHPWIYSLSFAVYCTSWTYYGSVGAASKSGMLFLAIYLGPMLSMTLWGSVLEKMAMIKEKYRLTNAVDFVSARFDKSTKIGIYGAIFTVIGIIPYIALQLKSIQSTWDILTHSQADLLTLSAPDPFSFTGIVTVGVISIITIFFGIRKLDATERHPGMMFMLAIECLVKLVAFVAVGVFATYYLNNGYGELLDRLPSLVNPEKYNFMGDSKSTLTDLTTWITYLILASSAILFLPRQFHVGVVENVNIDHIKKAKWQFPIYLFIINLFVLPIAIAGLSQNDSSQSTDFFVLSLPLKSNNHFLTLVAFIGGLSAAVGMIVIETMALSTIFSNNILVPMIARLKGLSFLSKHILKLRWISATGIIFISYWYMCVVGTKYALVAMGMISFAAILQFAPIILAGLYWKKASKAGAFTGLVLGSIVWFYTLMIPALAKSGWLDASILETGLFGINFLNPESLFGVKNLHYLTHSVLWSMFANIGGIVVGSIMFAQSNSEALIAEDFIEIQSAQDDGKIQISEEDKTILLEDKLELIRGILSRYLNTESSSHVVDEMIEKCGLIKGQKISLVDLSEIKGQTEKILSGYIGSAGAHFELRNSLLFTAAEEENLNKLYSSMLTTMKINPKELSKKISLFQEKQIMMEREQQILEERISQKSLELESQKQKTFEASKLSALGEMSAGVAHEINNPLAIILGATFVLEQCATDDQLTKEHILKYVGKVNTTVARISKLITGMRNLSRSTEGESFVLVSLQDIINDATSLCDQKFRDEGIEIKIAISEEILNLHFECRRIGLSQVFINLLNNSRDAVLPLEEKWVKIEATIDAKNLKIRYIDSGAGIPAAIRDKVLQPFFSTKEIGKGTGLGLSLCNSIIAGHGGQFGIDDQDPNTCFTITIPLRQKESLEEVI